MWCLRAPKRTRPWASQRGRLIGFPPSSSAQSSPSALLTTASHVAGGPLGRLGSHYCRDETLSSLLQRGPKLHVVGISSCQSCFASCSLCLLLLLLLLLSLHLTSRFLCFYQISSTTFTSNHNSVRTIWSIAIHHLPVALCAYRPLSHLSTPRFTRLLRLPFAFSCSQQQQSLVLDSLIDICTSEVHAGARRNTIQAGLLAAGLQVATFCTTYSSSPFCFVLQPYCPASPRPIRSPHLSLRTACSFK